MNFEKGEPPFTFSIASDSLRRKVSECVDQICSLRPENTVKYLPQLVELSTQQGFDQALTIQLDSDHDGKRVVVASFLLMFGAAGLECVPPKIVERCERILTHALRHESQMIRILAVGMLAQCSMMSDCKLPERALAPLREMVGGSDATLAPIAAMALSNSPDPEPEAFNILSRSLDSNDESKIGMVAPALVKAGIHDHHALSAIKERFEKFSPLILRAILLAISKIGPAAIDLFDNIAAVLKDSAQASTHHLAAMALGSICCGTDRAIPLLMKALESSDWITMDGAADGLSASKRVPQQALDLIVARISGPNVQLRHSAARAMGTLKGFDDTFIPILIRRLREETDQDTLLEVARSLAIAGKPAIAPLLECRLHGKADESLYAANALVTIGKDAAEAIADYIPKLRGPRDLGLLLNVLEGMGRESAPAVPIFAEFLECVEDELLALNIVRMLCYSGPSAKCAIRSLVRYVGQRGTDNDDINVWVKRTLASHLPHSSGVLREEINSATGAARERLETLLSAIEGAPRPPQNRLTGFRDIRTVERFVAAADLLVAKGPNSLRGLAALLKAQSGKSARNGFSPNSLSRALKSLEEQFKEPLTSPRKFTVFALTRFGETILTECKQFLRNSESPKTA
jgi:hypothetical protein